MADRGAERILEFDGEGTAIGGGFGGTEPGEGGFEAVYGVAVDNSAGACKGDVYVANEGRHLERFLPVPVRVDTRCAAGLEAKNNAESVAVDSHGNLYAGLYPLKTVWMSLLAKGRRPRYRSGLSATKSVEGVAVDVAGDVYVVNEKHNVVKFNSSEVKKAAMVNWKPKAKRRSRSRSIRKTAKCSCSTARKRGRSEYHVTRYDATGKKLESFGEGEIGSSPEGGIAYSPKYGEVYVTDQTKEEVHIYRKTSRPPKSKSARRTQPARRPPLPASSSRTARKRRGSSNTGGRETPYPKSRVARSPPKVRWKRSHGPGARDGIRLEAQRQEHQWRGSLQRRAIHDCIDCTDADGLAGFLRVCAYRDAER